MRFRLRILTAQIDNGRRKILFRERPRDHVIQINPGERLCLDSVANLSVADFFQFIADRLVLFARFLLAGFFLFTLELLSRRFGLLKLVFLGLLSRSDLLVSLFLIWLS